MVADQQDEGQVNHPGHIPDQGIAKIALGAEDETSETVHVWLL